MQFKWVLVVVLFGSGFASTGECQEPAMKASAGQQAEKVTRRLPNNFGKIGLSEEQKQKIYTIQAEYRLRIEQLLQELEDLRNEEILEIQNTLTQPQKAELQRLLEESRKKRESKKGN